MNKTVIQMSNMNLLEEIAKVSKKNNKQTEKQKKVMEAAVKLFAEKGYSNTSTSEIAKKAGVSEGTIFKHYGTKENLLLSIIVPFLKEFFPEMADELIDKHLKDNGSFEEFLRALLKDRSSFLSENREIFQVFIKELFYKEELRKELFPIIFEYGSNKINKVIDYFKIRGEIKNLPNKEIIKMITTMIGGTFISNFILLNKQSINEEEQENIISFILNGIDQSDK